MQEVCTQMGKANETNRQSMPVDWATDVDELMSPVPTMFPERAAAEHVDLLPSVSNQPAHIPTNNTTPAMGANPISNTIPVAPTSITRNNLGINPTPTVLVTPSLPMVHGPHDLSALRSGMNDPSSSIKHCRRHIAHPLCDFSSLHSSMSNPWGSLHHRDHRSYPLHSRCEYLR